MNVSVLRLFFFLTVPWIGLQCVVFTDHTHLLFDKASWVLCDFTVHLNDIVCRVLIFSNIHVIYFKQFYTDID